MFRHYLKIALRNICKYALQNIISILGLAAGFTALSLSAYWYRYENTYDRNHPDWQRIYTFKTNSEIRFDNVSWSNLKDRTFQAIKSMPEIESVATMTLDFKYPFKVYSRSFVEMMGLKLESGSLNAPGCSSIAVNSSMARKLCGEDNPIGRDVTLGELMMATGYDEPGPPADSVMFRIDAVFKDMEHSVFWNEASIMMINDSDPGSDYFMTMVKVKPGTDIDLLTTKLAGIEADEYEVPALRMENISKVHRTEGRMQKKHLRIFSLTSLLLMLCAMVNCITLLVSRIDGRRREMGLRRANGSSVHGLDNLFAVELLLPLGTALLLSLLLVFIFRDKLSEYAQISGSSMNLVWGCLAVMLLVLLLSLAASVLTVSLALRHSLRTTMSSALTGNRGLRRIGLALQLFISTLCLFCCLFMLNQLIFVRHANWGFEIHNLANIELFTPIISPEFGYNKSSQELESELNSNRNHKAGVMRDRLMQLPYVRNATLSHYSFGNNSFSSGGSSIFWNDESLADLSCECEMLMLTDPGNPAYGFTVIVGNIPQDGLTDDKIIVSQSVCDSLAIDDPIGHCLYQERISFEIVAVIQDVYFRGPFENTSAFVITSGTNRSFYGTNHILVDYMPGKKNELKEWLENNKSDTQTFGNYMVYFLDDWLNDHLKHADNLLHLLYVIAAVCMLIAITGIYSIVALSCHERRREIAVRKIHGAKLRDVLYIFVHEYGLILLIASVLAFVVGGIAMHGWLRQFQLHATGTWWIYLTILACMALVICLTVGHRVLKATRENPADVIKSE